MPDLKLEEKHMRLYYGYENGKFVLVVTDDTVDNPHIFARVSIRRSDAQKVSKHMQFGKEGDTRVIQDHEQLIVPGPTGVIHYNPHEYAHCDGKPLTSSTESMHCELCGYSRHCYYYCPNHHRMICMEGK